MADDSKDEEVAEEVEAEVAEENAPTEDTVLSGDDFIQQLRSRRRTAVVEGCRVQSLSAKAYQAFKGLRYKAAMDANGEDREEQFKLGECAAWLVLGVVEPKFDYHKWLFELDGLDGGAIERIVETIKELSGATDIEVELAKKAYAQIRGDTTS